MKIKINKLMQKLISNYNIVADIIDTSNDFEVPYLLMESQLGIVLQELKNRKPYSGKQKDLQKLQNQLKHQQRKANSR